MELELIRTYYPTGTNAVICHQGKIVSHSIELPWRDNLVNRSCIPEGRYQLIKRYSERWEWHIEIMGVKDRSFILFHPANNALRELRGCIAPVSLITGIGRGSESRKANEKIKTLVFKAFTMNEAVFLNIYSLN